MSLNVAKLCSLGWYQYSSYSIVAVCGTNEPTLVQLKKIIQIRFEHFTQPGKVTKILDLR